MCGDIWRQCANSNFKLSTRFSLRLPVVVHPQTRFSFFVLFCLIHSSFHSWAIMTFGQNVRLSLIWMSCMLVSHCRVVIGYPFTGQHQDCKALVSRLGVGQNQTSIPYGVIDFCDSKIEDSRDRSTIQTHYFEVSWSGGTNVFCICCLLKCWGDVKGSRDPNLLNSLAAVQRRSRLKVFEHDSPFREGQSQGKSIRERASGQCSHSKASSYYCKSCWKVSLRLTVVEELGRA